MIEGWSTSEQIPAQISKKKKKEKTGRSTHVKSHRCSLSTFTVPTCRACHACVVWQSWFAWRDSRGPHLKSSRHRGHIYFFEPRPGLILSNSSIRLPVPLAFCIFCFAFSPLRRSFRYVRSPRHLIRTATLSRNPLL